MSLPEIIFAKIKTKRSVQSGVTPNANSLELGELAVNILDRKIWIGNPEGAIDPVLLMSPISGSGPINVSSTNAISFSAENIIDNTLPIGKINRSTILGDLSGFLKWSGTAWEFDTPSGNGGGSSYFDFCTYSDFFGDLSIFGGTANIEFCPFVETSDFNVSSLSGLSGSNGILIENNTISFDVNSLSSEQLTGLNKPKYLTKTIEFFQENQNLILILQIKENFVLNSLSVHLMSGSCEFGLYTGNFSSNDVLVDNITGAILDNNIYNFNEIDFNFSEDDILYLNISNVSTDASNLTVQLFYS